MWNMRSSMLVAATVSDCDKRHIYVVICPDNGSKSCFAGASRIDSTN